MEFETRRKIIHITEGSLAAGLVYYDLFSIPVMAMLLGIGTILSIITKSRRAPVLDDIAYIFDRDEHRDTLPGQGSLYLLTGFIIAVAFFDKNVAMAAIITVTFGDSISALVGRHFGRIDNPFNHRKHLEGTVLGFAVSAALNTLFLSVTAAVIVSAAGMIVESLHVKVADWELDDNISIPVAVGLTYLVIRAVHPV